jgi:hypothetical protein
MKSLLSLPFLVAFALSGFAGERTDYTTPAAGSPLRDQLLDTIRVPTEEHLGQRVVFKVNTLRATDTWAFFVGKAIQPSGEPVDYRRSKEFKKDPKATQIVIDEGNLYGGVNALLKKEGTRWTIILIVYDATDVQWLDWDKRFGAPTKLIADPIN